MRNEIFIFNIAKFAVKSVLTTTSIHPRPGLVTPLENSALDGTDFPRVLDGIMGLFPSFVNCASIGAETEELKPEDIMTLLRPAGQIGERDIALATRGRLTFRGNIFLLGLLCAAAGRLLAQKRNLTLMALTLTASSFVRGIIERELWPLTDLKSGESNDNREKTAGEKAYILYGIDGCRGEAARGYPLTQSAASLLQKLEATHGHLPLRDRAAHVLLHVLSENADTSLAMQGGIDRLLQVQAAAKKALDAGGMLTEAGREAVLNLDRDFRAQGIAPKGSDVILSAALYTQALGGMYLTRSGYKE